MDLEIFIVWISIMASDVESAAEKAVKKFSDHRVTQFFDPQQRSGKAIAESIGYPGEVAWDMYLFYPPGVKWEAGPPAPEEFFHQLADSWADQSRLYEAEKLGKILHKTMERYD